MFYKKTRSLTSVSAICIAAVLAGCASPTTPQPTSAQPAPGGQIANPASQYCIDEGGTLSFQTRGDGGEYGVCSFEDNQECEEWALFRGECPVGGVKITGYTTQAAVYCAITGGMYQVTGNSNTDQEDGTCTFPNGQTCDASDYYNGICDPNTTE